MAPIGNPHAVCVTGLQHVFEQKLGERAVVRVQQPIRLLPDTEPEPDIAIVQPPPARYLSGHPSPGDVLLIIEVADTSLAYDRDTKIPRFGREAIPEAWLWDLGSEQVRVYREPGPKGYGSVQTYGRGDTLTPLAFPDVRITVDEVL